MDYSKLCRGAHRLVKADVRDGDAEKLRASLDFLREGATPEEVRSLAIATAGLAGAFCAVLLVLLSLFLGFSVLWLVVFPMPAVLFFYLRNYPVYKAESEKKKALAQMPEAASYLMMSLRINPNIENAVRFAAGHSSGLFKKRLSEIISNIRTGRGGAEAGLEKLAGDFAKWDEFKRAMMLIIASTRERTEDRRQETLDKASEVLLGGLAARSEREARGLHTPVMVVFTFGVIMPLILIALVPFMSLMGIQVGAAAFALLYTVVLPLMLAVMIRFIASGRPVTVQPPRVPTEAGKGMRLAIAAAAGIGLCAMLALPGLGEMRYMPALWGGGAAAGLFLMLGTAGVRKTRKKVKTLENEFCETLHRLGITLSEGRPLEDAMASSGSEYMKRAAGSIRSLNTDIRSALFDETYGSLRGVYSDTIRGVFEIITSVSEKGSDAMSKVASRMSSHIRDLKKSEAEIERALGGVVSSMRITAMVVAPLVGGLISSMSVIMSKTMEKSQAGGQSYIGMGAAGASGIDPAIVAAVIGVYVMESAAILVMFGTEIMHGNDRVMKRHRIGMALPVSILVFTICAWLAKGMLGGIAK